MTSQGKIDWDQRVDYRITYVASVFEYEGSQGRSRQQAVVHKMPVVQSHAVVGSNLGNKAKSKAPQKAASPKKALKVANNSKYLQEFGHKTDQTKIPQAFGHITNQTKIPQAFGHKTEWTSRRTNQSKQG